MIGGCPQPCRQSSIHGDAFDLVQIASDAVQRVLESRDVAIRTSRLLAELSSLHGCEAERR